MVGRLIRVAQPLWRHMSVHKAELPPAIVAFEVHVGGVRGRHPEIRHDVVCRTGVFRLLDSGSIRLGNGSRRTPGLSGRQEDPARDIREVGDALEQCPVPAPRDNERQHDHGMGGSTQIGASLHHARLRVQAFPPFWGSAFNWLFHRSRLGSGGRDQPRSHLDPPGASAYRRPATCRVKTWTESSGKEMLVPYHWPTKCLQHVTAPRGHDTHGRPMLIANPGECWVAGAPLGLQNRRRPVHRAEECSIRSLSAISVERR